MDQVLKDLMLEVADVDQRGGLDGMMGEQGDAEIANIMGKIYKVRPFGRRLSICGNSILLVSLHL